MKFGKNLQKNAIPTYPYLDYKSLKKIIKHDPSLFLEALDKNLDKVDDFFNKSFTKYHYGFSVVVGRFRDVGEVNDEEVDDLAAALSELISQLQRLFNYSSSNTRGFTKILKKYDKKLNKNMQSTYMHSKVLNLPFANPEPLITDLKSAKNYMSQISKVKSSDVTDPIAKLKLLPAEGLASADTDRILSSIHNDNAVELITTLKESNEKVLTNPRQVTNILLRCLLAGKRKCVADLMRHCDMQVLFGDELNSRNVVHKYIVLVGRHMTVTRNANPFTGLSGEIPIKAYERKEGMQKELDGYSTIFKYFLELLDPEKKDLLSASDIYKRLPLHYAVQFGLLDICSHLCKYMVNWGIWVERGYEQDWQDGVGQTPLYSAIIGDQSEIVQILVSSDRRDPFATEMRPSYSRNSFYPISLAARLDRVDIVRILIKEGYDINVRDENGETPLHLACRAHSVEFVKLLLDGSDYQTVNLENKDNTYGWTPLFVAAVEGYTDIVDLLIEAGSNIETADHSGWHAFEHAVFRGHFECGKKIALNPNDFINSISNGFASTATTPGSTTKSPNGTNYFDKKYGMETIKQVGHHYLKDRSMIAVTLGSHDRRISQSPVQFDLRSLADGLLQLDSAFSLLVSAKGAEGQAVKVDLPLDDTYGMEPIIFYTTDVDSVQLYFDIVPLYQVEGKKVLARSAALLSTVRTSVGRNRHSLHGNIILPIIESSSLSVIGKICFEYQVIKPFQHSQMTLSRRPFWKKLENIGIIGHRGLGMNNPTRKSLQLGENTLQSFVAAASLGAEYVEFDVQLTKDDVPVIYHDFLVGETGVDAPVSSLSLEQFLAAKSGNENGVQLSKVSSSDSLASSNGSNTTNGHMANGHNGDNNTTFRRSRSMSLSVRKDTQEARTQYTRDYKIKGFKGNSKGISIEAPFATLEEVFKRIPKETGFNIECKYPMLAESEAEEMDETAIEVNHWVDTILKVIFDNARSRDIMLSSFHPTICLLLAQKQSVYPVLFLTDAGTHVAADIRASSLQEAVRFASRWNLLGIVAEATPFCLCPRLVSVVKGSGLVAFTYGSNNDDVEKVELQKKAGVDAVIVDSLIKVKKALRKPLNV